MLRVTCTGAGLEVEDRETHALHQHAYMPATHTMSLALQQTLQHAGARERMLCIKCIQADASPALVNRTPVSLVIEDRTLTDMHKL